MRRPYIFLLPILLGQCLDGSMPGVMTSTPDQKLVISSAPVLLDATNPGRRRIGALTFAGGWALSSGTRSFGGLSSIDMNGNRVTALSDIGATVRFRLGRFGTISDASIDQLPPGCGSVVRKFDNDTEGLAHNPARDTWWVSYEWRNGICRIDGDMAQAEALSKPEVMKDWPKKQGPESIIRLADGRFLVIAEYVSPVTATAVVALFDRDPTDPAAQVTKLAYRPPAGFNPTDVAQLPDGRLLILNRRFAIPSLFTSELVLVDPRVMRPPGMLTGRTIARFAPPVIADNFEGLSISIEHGKPVVWIISDDNYMRWQRTLLLKFYLN